MSAHCAEGQSAGSTSRARRLHAKCGRTFDGAHAAALEFEQGPFVKGRLVNPADGKVIDAEVGAPALRIAYDRLPGTIEFTMVDAEYQPGKYRFEIEAMLDGESITGWWTGTRDGKAVLSKSAKLHGQMKARGE